MARFPVALRCGAALLFIGQPGLKFQARRNFDAFSAARGKSLILFRSEPGHGTKGKRVLEKGRNKKEERERGKKGKRHRGIVNFKREALCRFYASCAPPGPKKRASFRARDFHQRFPAFLTPSTEESKLRIESLEHASD